MGYVWHELFGWHDTGTHVGYLGSNPRAGLQPFAHFESAESKTRMHELLAVSGLLDALVRVPARPATDDEILRVHTVQHLNRIVTESGLPKGGDAGDGVSPFGRGGADIARLAAGAAIAATDAVLDGRVDNAYALVRPPGHHATPTTGMGFCIFNNLAIALRHAQSRGVRRVAVVDWDVHHGNGTQDVFFADPDVLTISVHQDNLFPPASGALTERGTGQGGGYNINVPLPAVSGDGAYVDTVTRVVVPALRVFQPELIMVSCGFDAGAMDPLAQMMVTAAGFRALATAVADAAQELCGGRLVMVHEGGYSPVYVPFCGLAVVEVLAGKTTGIGDPFGPSIAAYGGQDLQPHQRALIDRAAGMVAAAASTS